MGRRYRLPWAPKEENAQSMHKAKWVMSPGGLSLSKGVIRMAGGNWTWETPQSLKCRPHKHEDLSLIAKIYILIQVWQGALVIPVLGRLRQATTGSRQPASLAYQARCRPTRDGPMKQSRWLLRNGIGSGLLATKHMHAYVYAYLHCLYTHLYTPKNCKKIKISIEVKIRAKFKKKTIRRENRI